MRTIARSAFVTLVALVIAGGSAVPAVAATASKAKPGAGITGIVFVAGSTISCGTPTSCLAVGSDFNHKSGTPTPTAQAWNGTRWRSVSVPTPEGAQFAVMTGVSCRSATSCLAVGDYDLRGADGGELPFALTWNGTSLRRTGALPLPKNSALVSFSGVSCVTTRDCVAVGSLLSGAKPLLAETWNGARWTMRAAPGVGRTAFSDLTAVSCLSATSCTVAGEAYSLTGKQTMLLARWNGRSFSAMKATPPAGAQTLLLNSVSCVSGADCVAAGLSVNSAATAGFGFAEIWNGRSWSAHKVAAPKGDTLSALIGVSCVTARSCIAVGAAGTSKRGAASALAYNGTSWSALKVPAPGAGKSSDFSGVSCPKAGDCVAIGGIGPAGQATSTPLAGRWNGSVWRLSAA